MSRSLRRVAGIVAGASLLASVPVLAERHGDVHRERMTLGDWRLDIARDRFSGGIACRLMARDYRALYRDRAVGFRMRNARDVVDAVYRIDGGTPRVSRDDLPALIAAGVPFDRGPMDNARASTVWVPFDVLRQGNSVAIEPGPGQYATRYHFRGLVALHDIAVERGCTPEDRFIER